MALNHFPTCGYLRLLLAALLGLGFSARADESEDAGNVVTNQPVLKVDIRANVEGSFMPYRYAFITAGSTKFTFLVPDGYRVDSTDATKVKLISPDCSCLIIVGLSNGGALAGSAMTAEALRTYVQDHYSDALIQGDQVVCANGYSAPAVDFNWKADMGITRSARTAFIPTTTGMLEFTLTTSPEQFQSGLNQLNLVMLTFRTGANGRFDYVIGSNQP